MARDSDDKNDTRNAHFAFLGWVAFLYLGNISIFGLFCEKLKFQFQFSYLQ